jgi:hypothetical protein
MLKEKNTRTGFLEIEQLHDVMRHLAEELRPVVEFSYITGLANRFGSPPASMAAGQFSEPVRSDWTHTRRRTTKAGSSR